MSKEKLALKEKWPTVEEVDSSGAVTSKIVRGDSEYKKLSKNVNSDIKFKLEEIGNDDDQRMNTNLSTCIDTLAQKVKTEWVNAGKPLYKLRVTEAYDGDDEHGAKSIHYEGRAADINLWDIKNSKVDTSHLDRLAGLATESDFDWVFYEDILHVHVSCKKDNLIA